MEQPIPNSYTPTEPNYVGFVQVTEGIPSIIGNHDIVQMTEDGPIHHSKEILRLWKVEELAAIGVYPYILEDVPLKQHQFPVEKPATEWVLDGDIFTVTQSVMEIDLESAKTEHIRVVNEMYQYVIQRGFGEYPDAETRTWDRQEAEARAWLLDNTATTPLIDGMSAARGMDKAELVQRIIANADDWVAFMAFNTGKRQKLLDQIKNAQTLDELREIGWDYDHSQVG